jgi:predicted TIM-barrel fold metal-dependent hydrolase
MSNVDRIMTAPAGPERLLMVSSDGHASAQMEEYRDYLPTAWHQEFDEFCKVYKQKGSRNFETQALLQRFDTAVVDVWQENVMKPRRYRGLFEPTSRFEEMNRHGVAAEVLFPDFGLPFELYSPLLAAEHGYRRTPAQKKVANQAYNRWLVDFCSQAPERFAALALVNFEVVEEALDEIAWAKSVGIRGVIMPMFTEEHPVFHPRFDPIWSLLQELEMPINSHISLSGIKVYEPKIPPFPHPAVATPVFGRVMGFYCQQILSHLIWGGVLERFPNLQVVFTEQGSGWVVGELQSMDYSWEGSFFRRDVREIVRHTPSFYFRRQCHLGSSLFSKAEAEARYQIGIDKITVGMDFPHLEGTWGVGPGHIEYLRATLGAAGVLPDEARLMVGENALRLWGFDRVALQPVVANIGPTIADLLSPPERDDFPLGDVHKPLSMTF